MQADSAVGHNNSLWERGHPFDMLQEDPQVELLRRTSWHRPIAARTPSVARRPVLLVKHLAKSGGSAVIALLTDIVPQLAVWDERKRVGPEDRAKHFVLGLVREPCSTYVSLWAYGSLGRGDFRTSMDAFLQRKNRSEAPDLYGADPPFTSPADISRFRRWVQMPSVRGSVTARFLNGYSWRPSVDCWVFTDRLAESLRSCLTRYIDQGGVLLPAAKVEDITDSVIRSADREHANGHASAHGECAAYFDRNLAARVEQGFDRSLLRAFGWTGCCGTRRPGAGRAKTAGRSNCAAAKTGSAAAAESAAPCERALASS